MKSKILGLVATALFVGSVPAAQAVSVLVWSSGNELARTQGVAAWIQTVGGFDSVTGVNADSLTFSQLDAYDAILYFSNGNTAGNVSRGDVLADFANTGKRLVLGTFAFANQGGNTLAGRLISDGLAPYVVGGFSLYTYATMASNDGSGFFSGVNAVAGYYRDDVSLVSGAISRASWSDGETLLAVKGNVVGVNLFPDDSFGSVSGDYRRLFANALGGRISVPEPGTLALLGLGLAGLGLSRRRKVA